MKEWSTFSRFPCTAEEYYALMLDGDFQRKVHLEGLKMGCYDVTDDPQPDGTVRRVVFSEPKLNLPAVLERVMKRAQAYHEHAVFDPSKLDRRVKVIPCMGAERMDFSFHETVRPGRGRRRRVRRRGTRAGQSAGRMARTNPRAIRVQHQ